MSKEEIIIKIEEQLIPLKEDSYIKNQEQKRAQDAFKAIEKVIIDMLGAEGIDELKTEEAEFYLADKTATTVTKSRLLEVFSIKTVRVLFPELFQPVKVMRGKYKVSNRNRYKKEMV